MENILSKFSHISSALAKIPSMIFALVYLLLIPIFGYFYNQIPEQFFHETVMYEFDFIEAKEEILDELKTSIIDTFIEFHGSNEITVNNWTFDISEIDLEDLKKDNRKMSFKMYLRLWENKKGQKLGNLKASFESRWIELWPIISFSTIRSMRIVNLEDISIFVYKTIFVKSSSWEDVFKEFHKPSVLPLETIFPYKDSGMKDNASGMKGEYLKMPITLSLDKEIRAYVKATEGFPHSIAGGFWRMFYLSAVTITTLGYGDIVPITSLSRILISMESIIGIILIGLFVNSLIYQRRQ